MLALIEKAKLRRRMFWARLIGRAGVACTVAMKKRRCPKIEEKAMLDDIILYVGGMGWTGGPGREAEVSGMDSRMAEPAKTLSRRGP